MGGITGNPEYGLAAIKAGIDAAKQSVSMGKAKVANALAAKGIGTAADATFDTIAANINKITTLSQGTQDATAGAGQVLSGYTAYVRGSKITGSVPSQGAQTITPGTSAKYVEAGRYLSGRQTIAGDANLIPANIAKGKSIFGVAGNLESAISTHILLKEIKLTRENERLFYVDTQPIQLSFEPVYALLIVKLFARAGSPINYNTDCQCIMLARTYIIYNGTYFDKAYGNGISCYIRPVINKDSKQITFESDQNNYRISNNYTWDSHIPSGYQKNSDIKAYVLIS